MMWEGWSSKSNKNKAATTQSLPFFIWLLCVLKLYYYYHYCCCGACVYVVKSVNTCEYHIKLLHEWNNDEEEKILSLIFDTHAAKLSLLLWLHKYINNFSYWFLIGTCTHNTHYVCMCAHEQKRMREARTHTNNQTEQYK